MSNVEADSQMPQSVDTKDEAMMSPTQEKKEGIGVLARLLRLSPLGRKSSVTTESPSPPEVIETNQTYYGVYIPCEIKVGPDVEILHVYTDKVEALKVVKKYKLARFKVFKSRRAAVAFALRGADITEKVVDGSFLTNCYANGKTCNGPSTNQLVGNEKPSQFKAPKPQEMVQFRKTIDAGNLTAVCETIWENPRYLVSSGDTPAILQEGSRYNALHIAAKAKRAEMCNLILTTVGDPAFVQLLYGEDNMEICRERACMLLDLYINMPDKGMNDTPLHFAVKLGAADVVDLLTSYPPCNTEARNKFGERPKDIICQRCTPKDPILCERIALMLSEKFYVPVLHSEDESCQPVIGQPFNPVSPPVLNTDPVSPRLEIMAYAGPMGRHDAVNFRRKWKTPPRNQSQSGSVLLRPETFRLKDCTKGLEKFGRNLAQEMRVGWKEYWPFLDTFTDLSSEEGLLLLESYLQNKYSTAFKQSPADLINDQNSQEEMSFSGIVLSNTGQSSKDVFNSSLNTSETILSPITDLCQALNACALRRTTTIRPHYARMKARIRRLSDMHRDPKVEEETVHFGLSPLICIEKTCQVFAKRMAVTLQYALTADTYSIGDGVRSELKHLQHTVASYMDDPRFTSIQFELLHSRVSQLIACYVKQHTTGEESLDLIMDSLLKLTSNKEDIDIYSSDEDESIQFKNGSKVPLNNVGAHVKCLVTSIGRWMTMDLNRLKKSWSSEEDYMETWAQLTECPCSWQDDPSERINRKNILSKRYSFSPKSYDLISRKLMFEQEIGDSKLKTPSGPDVNFNSPAGDMNIFRSTDSKFHCMGMSRKQPSGSEAELISDDDSSSESDDDSFYSATDFPAWASDDDEEMADVSDLGAIDVYIYGDQPTKMDRLVYDAIVECEISVQQYPNTYKWRHAIGLYPAQERESWLFALLDDDSIDSPISYSLHLGKLLSSTHQQCQRKPPNTLSVHSPLTFSNKSPHKLAVNTMSLSKCSTPKKTDLSLLRQHEQAGSPSVPLQVSSWLRVTGPNSPRSANASQKYGQNVSFGY